MCVAGPTIHSKTTPFQLIHPYPRLLLLLLAGHIETHPGPHRLRIRRKRRLKNMSLPAVYALNRLAGRMRISVTHVMNGYTQHVLECDQIHTFILGIVTHPGIVVYVVVEAYQT